MPVGTIHFVADPFRIPVLSQRPLALSVVVCLAISSTRLLADSIQEEQVVWTKILTDLVGNFCLFSESISVQRHL